MSDDDQGKHSSINWGGLVKTIIAGVAIVAGIQMMAPGLLSHLIPSLGEGTAPSFLNDITAKGVGEVIQRIGGLIVAGLGLNYLFSDHSKNENAERHSENYREAKESFAIREDMRKMQTVMMARMKAAGHDPAMAMQQGPVMG